jgi:hypothetical protein
MDPQEFMERYHLDPSGHSIDGKPTAEASKSAAKSTKRQRKAAPKEPSTTTASLNTDAEQSRELIEGLDDFFGANHSAASDSLRRVLRPDGTRRTESLQERALLDALDDGTGTRWTASLEAEQEFPGGIVVAVVEAARNAAEAEAAPAESTAAAGDCSASSAAAPSSASKRKRPKGDTGVARRIMTLN